MKMIIYKKGDRLEGVRIGEVAMKGSIGGTNGLLKLVNANLMQFLSEYLGEHILQTGVRSIQSCGEFWSSFRKKAGVPKDVISGMLRETTIGGTSVVEEDGFTWQDDPVVASSGKADLIVGVEFYDEGFLLKSSKELRNILGGAQPAYFEKITSKNFKMTGRNYAKVFKDEKALRKYLLDKEDIFSYMTEKNGWTFEMEPASAMYVNDRKKPMTGKVFDEIGEILSRINGTEVADPEFTYMDTPMEEALSRMREMDLLGTVTEDFRNGKLYMSEFGGILYDLNDEAMEAVERTKEYGLPYHVVRFNSPTIGDMYSVLYVSEYPEEWHYEHLDPRDGRIIANVYNASMGISEIGSIWLEKANGGLVRTN